LRGWHRGDAPGLFAAQIDGLERKTPAGLHGYFRIALIIAWNLPAIRR
jgi:hypothetical protein